MTEIEEQAVVVLNTLHDNPLLSDIHRQALEVGITAIKALEEKPCEDCISRQSVKRKLQEHHDFFIHAYNGFSNMPQNDKSKVDEITNCIATIVNEPSITPQPKIGWWIYDEKIENWRCSECNETPKTMGYVGTADFMVEHFKYCNHCGAKMQEVENDT